MRLPNATLLGAFFLLTGCSVDIAEKAGPLEHFTKTIELDKSEQVRVQIKMGVGSLKVRGGSPNLLDAGFAYNVPDWKPGIRYEGSGFRSLITIEQPSSSHTLGSGQQYEWDLRLNDSKPLSLLVDLAPGKRSSPLAVWH